MDKPDPHELAETVIDRAGPGAAVDLADLLRDVPPDRVRAVLVQLRTAVRLPPAVRVGSPPQHLAS